MQTPTQTPPGAPKSSEFEFVTETLRPMLSRNLHDLEVAEHFTRSHSGDLCYMGIHASLWSEHSTCLTLNLLGGMAGNW